MNTNMIIDVSIKVFTATAIIFKFFIIPVLGNRYKNSIANNYIKEKMEELAEIALKKALGISDENDNIILFSDLDIKTQKMIIEWLPTEILEYKSFSPDDEDHKNLNNQLVKSLFRSQLAAKDGASKYNLFMCKLRMIPIILLIIALTIYIVSELMTKGVM